MRVAGEVGYAAPDWNAVHWSNPDTGAWRLYHPQSCPSCLQRDNGEVVVPSGSSLALAGGWLWVDREEESENEPERAKW